MEYSNIKYVRLVYMFLKKHVKILLFVTYSDDKKICVYNFINH